MRLVLITLASLGIGIAACSSTAEDKNASGSSGGTSGATSGGTSSGSSGGTSSGSSGGTSSGSSGDASSGSSGEAPPASTTEASVKIDGTCPAFTACGGSPSGTYDYTAGCLNDAFKALRQSCAAADTTGAKVTVSGSLYFAGSALTRKATLKISGSVVAPQSCTAGQCAAAEALLKGSFDTVACTGTSDCTCTISKEQKIENATTFTVAGNTITTKDGETYEFCEKGTSLEYSGKSAGSEDGVWTLTKR